MGRFLFEGFDLHKSGNGYKNKYTVVIKQKF